MLSNNEFNTLLRQRTFDVSLRVVKLVKYLPNNTIGWKLGDQLIRSGTAIGALTEEACAGLSYRDFIHGIKMARKETYETRFWIRLHVASDIVKATNVADLLAEIEEIAKILSSMVKTGNTKLNRQ